MPTPVEQFKTLVDQAETAGRTNDRVRIDELFRKLADAIPKHLTTADADLLHRARAARDYLKARATELMAPAARDWDLPPCRECGGLDLLVDEQQALELPVLVVMCRACRALRMFGQTIPDHFARVTAKAGAKQPPYR